MACASTVAVVVRRRDVGGLDALLQHLAPCSRRVLQLDLLATATPSLVIVGLPNFLSMTRCGPSGRASLHAAP